VEFADVVASRHMTRHFRADPLDPVVLETIVATALRTPSAGFTQGIDVILLTEAPARERFWSLASEVSWRSSSPAASELMAAPAVVVPVADPAAYLERYRESDKTGSFLSGRAAEAWPVPYWTVDAAFTVMQLLLAATDAELGALFFALHGDAAELLGGLGVPPGRIAIGGVLLGHPSAIDPRTSPSRRPRRGIDEVVHHERW
jgi:nitroreductase